jgi:hypothetical protein
VCQKKRTENPQVDPLQQQPTQDLYYEVGNPPAYDDECKKMILKLLTDLFGNNGAVNDAWNDFEQGAVDNPPPFKGMPEPGGTMKDAAAVGRAGSPAFFPKLARGPGSDRV